jgi:hypothetical protein
MVTVIGDGASGTCKATCKDGSPCQVGAVGGKTLCAGHDPETRARAQAAGAESVRRRPGFLSREQAEQAVVFETRQDIKLTLERLARHVVCGELEKGAVNATILAANGALAVMNDQDRSGLKRAGSMTDEELDAEIEADVMERIKRRTELERADQ